MLNLFSQMAILLLVGCLFRKLKILTPTVKKGMTDFVLYAVLPCNIVRAFSQKVNAGVWSALFIGFGIAVIAQIVAFIITKIAYNKFPLNEKSVLQYGTVCSNAGFIGNPLAESVYGTTGLLYASFFLIPQRIVIWTAGISYFSHEGNWKQTLKRIITHPSIIAVEIGMIIMLFGIELPSFLMNAISSLGVCTTPLSFVLIGTVLAEIHPKEIVSLKLLYYSFLRLIALPGILVLICRILNVEQLVASVAVLLTAAPMGTSVPIFAGKYGGDEIFATKSLVLSTLLSLFTLPMWVLLLEMFY